MKKEWADKWIEALESGKYKQGKSNLCYVKDRERFYCCLGVLAKEVGAKEKIYHPKVSFERIKFDGERCFLSKKVQNITGIKSHNGSYENNGCFPSLSLLNDTGKSFTEIAQIIREHWEEL